MQLAVSQTVRIPKTAEIVAARIRKAIITGELKAGDNLPPEAQLITQFEVSRPTLREAIRILESENLILISRGARRGAKILSPSADMISRAAGIALQAKGATIGDVYQARTVLEPQAARLAAENNPEQAGRALREQTQVELALAEQRDIAAFQHATSNFHRILLENSGNLTLSMIAYALDDLVNRHQTMVYRRKPVDDSEPRWAQIRYGIKSHERLADLISEGNAAAAQQHWERHMINAGKFWLDDFAQTAVIDILE